MLAAIHATHVVIDQLPHLPHVNHVVIDRKLSITDSPWAIGAAIASTLAAMGTLYLGWVTRNLAKATSGMASSTKDLARETGGLGSKTVAAARESIENDNANYRTTTTIQLINEYTQVAIPVTETIALTAFAAANQISMFADDLPELRRLRDAYNPNSVDPQDEQFRVLSTSIAILSNYYINALQLLRGELLNVPLFMNRFAKTFLASIKDVRTVNAEIHASPPQLLERLVPFERLCEEWRLRDPDAATSSEPAQASNPDRQS